MGRMDADCEGLRRERGVGSEGPAAGSSARALLAGAELYRKRTAMIEPVFGDTKFNGKIDRFQRRGRAACRSEWRLIMATHNLLKLWRATPAIGAA
jgi:hypothetical protein